MTNISFVKVRSHQLIDLHFGLVRIKSAQKKDKYCSNNVRAPIPYVKRTFEIQKRIDFVLS